MTTEDAKTALLVGACVVTSVIAWRVRRFNRERSLGGWPRLVSQLLGGALALACAIVVWPFSERIRVMGIPFPVMFLQRSSVGVWQDFLGLTTRPFFCLDAAIGGTLGYGAVGLDCSAKTSAE